MLLGLPFGLSATKDLARKVAVVVQGTLWLKSSGYVVLQPPVTAFALVQPSAGTLKLQHSLSPPLCLYFDSISRKGDFFEKAAFSGLLCKQ